ncbi:dihydroxyacetone phosphate acyltransferase-like [Acanthaster planci]|uniref:Dihydroxyacetone phosphate acyltransferase-like n=1 Tax=Acanthaster planci TaxID=133434 RepID=A0A8B7ZZW0_ACAPL|nr:dihydroxyacetone phosphate acyltransferase-like [Acanthaster planci]XP_022110648.1 dihydroxyacetone phosphate acyltransferase-like [Acanthaster planci]
MAHPSDEYLDLLEPRRRQYDISFALKHTASLLPEYQYVTHMSKAEIRTMVLKSRRLKHTVEELVASQNCEEKEVFAEAETILDEMAHNFTLNNIRFLAYLFSKAFKRLYGHIYVNKSGLEKLRKSYRDSPVVLLPTHRSYVDFLLISYMMFEYNLPLPYIAAGADFNNMKFVNTILRFAGAFYIRRSFGSDKLYWAIFTEYVQILVINGEAPLEFFIEGTRSRTGKFLPPKRGLLQVVVEPFMKGRVPDISLIPISISYDRILEETLHSREMLGIPKPKESTSGLFKASSIFQENFGNIMVHLGDPVSLKQMSLISGVDRSVHSLAPRFIFSMNAQEQQFVQELCLSVQLMQQRHMAVSPWVLSATLLAMSPGYQTSLHNMYRDMEWLKGAAVGLGTKLNWPVGKMVQSVFEEQLAVHRAMVVVDGDNIRLNAPRKVATAEEVMTAATVYIMLGAYRNHLLPSLAQPALVSLAFCGLSAATKDELLAQYQFLVTLFNRELTFHPKTTIDDFQSTVRRLQSSSVISVTGLQYSITSSGERLISFLCSLLHPFLLGYWVVCRYLLSCPCSLDSVTEQSLAKTIQKEIASLIAAGDLKIYDILSLNLLCNAILSLVQLGGIKRSKSGWMLIEVEISKTADKISEYIELPASLLTKLFAKKLAGPAAKL